MQFISRHLAILGLFMLAACGGPKPVVFDGSMVDFETADLLLTMESQKDTATVYEMEGKSSFSSPQSSASFRYTIRMKRDSVIWLDVMDPLLGLKVARAVIYPDSAVMYNRFESTWMAGGSNILEESIGLNLTFSQLQATLLGEPMYLPADANEMAWTMDSTSIRVEVNKPIRDSAWMNVPHFFKYLFLPTTEFPLQEQGFEMVGRKAYARYFYTDEEKSIPTEFQLNLEEGDVDIYFEMNHSVIRRDVDLHIPFSIPSGYERLR